MMAQERITAGTLLTPETFNEWNEKFIAEQWEKRASERAKAAASKESVKLTGATVERW